MFKVSLPHANTVDVQNSIITARYTSEIVIYNRQPDESGPYNACIATHPHAKYCYGFTAPKLATLLQTFADLWRPQLRLLAAPAMDISSLESYEEAVKCLKRLSVLPEEWLAFRADVLRHRYNVTRSVKELEEQVGRRLTLECAMIRRLANEVLAIEESWALLSDAIIAYEQANPKPSYLKKARSWFSGLGTKSSQTPPASTTSVAVSVPPPNATSGEPSIITSQSALAVVSEPLVAEFPGVAARQPPVVATTASLVVATTTSLVVATTVSLVVATTESLVVAKIESPLAPLAVTSSEAAPTTAPRLAPKKSYFKWSAPSSRSLSLTPSTDLNQSADSSSSHRSVSSSSTSSSNSSSTSDSSKFANSSSNFADAYDEELLTEIPSENTLGDLFVLDSAAKASASDTTLPATSIEPRFSPLIPFVDNSSAITAMPSLAHPSFQIFAVGPSFPTGSRLRKEPKLSWEMRFFKALFPLGNMSAADSAAQNEYNIMHNNGY
ncbi:hypothetical protein P7C70_g7870, partial [Phenoliferia sp. Uapishka_3]